MTILIVKNFANCLTDVCILYWISSFELGTLIRKKGHWPTDLSYTDDCAACEDGNFISLVQKKVFLV